MPQDLSRQYQLLEEYRQRARAALTSTRTELTAWFRDFFRKKKGPAKATHMTLVAVTESETPQPRWQFDWYPGMHSRSPIFTPTQPVPVFVTPADAAALGLVAADVYPLRSCAFLDMTAEAWQEAGGPSFPKQLKMHPWTSDGPDAPRPWVEFLREEIRKEAEGLRKKRPQFGMRPPQPLGLPPTPPELIEAVQSGAATAPTDWADALDRSGASEAAGLFRWLLRFHAQLAEEVQAVSPQFGFVITVNRSGTAWWWIGDMCSETDNADARQLGRLLSAWNETHPAVEWLLRNFGFPHAEVTSIRPATDEELAPKTIDLAAGQHLGPVADDVRVLKLNVTGWQPIEGDMQGE